MVVCCFWLLLFVVCCLSLFVFSHYLATVVVCPLSLFVVCHCWSFAVGHCLLFVVCHLSLVVVLRFLLFVICRCMSFVIVCRLWLLLFVNCRCLLFVAGLLFGTPEPPQKMFLSENVIFQGLRLSLGHFGQQAPESPVSPLQNGVSTSPLAPFIVDLLTFKDFPRSNSFFHWEF